MRSLEAESTEIYAEICEMVEALSQNLDEPEAKAIFEEVQSDYASFMEYFQEAIQDSADNKDEEAAELANTKIAELGNKISSNIDEMVMISQEQMQERVTEQEITYSFTNTVSLIVSILAMLTGIIVFIVILREIVAPIKATSEKLRLIPEKSIWKIWKNWMKRQSQIIF